MSIQNWVTENPVTVEAGESLGAAVSVMADRHIGAVLVVREGKLVGIFTERDLVKLCSAAAGWTLPRRRSAR